MWFDRLLMFMRLGKKTFTISKLELHEKKNDIYTNLQVLKFQKYP